MRYLYGLLLLLALLAGCLEEPEDELLHTVQTLPSTPSPIESPDNATLIPSNVSNGSIEIEEDLLENDLDSAIDDLEALQEAG